MTEETVAEKIDLDTETERSTDELLSDLRRLLREGRNRMDELADSLGLSAVDTERLIRAAEQAGDVTRDGYTGLGLYTVRLTDQGAGKLPELSEREEELARHTLAERDLRVLVAVGEKRCSMAEVRERMDEPLPPVELVPVVTHLVREGYLDESGLLRRYVELTPEGREVVSELA